MCYHISNLETRNDKFLILSITVMMNSSLDGRIFTIVKTKFEPQQKRTALRKSRLNKKLLDKTNEFIFCKYLSLKNSFALYTLFFKINLNQADLIKINFALNSPYWKCFRTSVKFYIPKVFNWAFVWTESWTFLETKYYCQIYINIKFLYHRIFGFIQVEIRSSIKKIVLSTITTF